MPPPRPPLVAVPKLPPRHNTEPDPETLTQVLQETRAKLLAENEKAPPEVLRTVRAIVDSPAWELNGHPQAAFVQPPHGPPSSSNAVGVNASASASGSNTNEMGTAPVPAAIEEISVEALQPLFKAIPYASKGGKEGSRGGTDKYECLWGGCGKIVKRRDHMVNHVKAHLGIKPFACPFVYEYLDQRQCWMRFLRIDDLKRHVRSVHKCDLTEDGGLKPRDPKPGEAMHPSTSTHAGSLLETRAPKHPGGSMVGAVIAAPSTSASTNPRAPGPRTLPIVIPPSAVPPPNWRPTISSGGGGGIAGPSAPRERGQEREDRSVTGAILRARDRPMSAESARRSSFGMRGETPPSPMDTRGDD